MLHHRRLLLHSHFECPLQTIISLSNKIKSRVFVALPSVVASSTNSCIPNLTPAYIDCFLPLIVYGCHQLYIPLIISTVHFIMSLFLSFLCIISHAQACIVISRIFLSYLSVHRLFFICCRLASRLTFIPGRIYILIANSKSKSKMTYSTYSKGAALNEP